MKRSAGTFPLSARTGGLCRRIRVTGVFANSAAMRNLVPGRVVAQPAVQVTANSLGAELGSDLGTGADKGTVSDLGAGAAKGRAGDSRLKRVCTRFVH